jgi:hypothetical protein
MLVGEILLAPGRQSIAYTAERDSTAAALADGINVLLTLGPVDRR